MEDLFFNETIKQLEAQGLKRSMRLIEGAQGRHLMLDGQKVLNFCSNNYLGLADDPRLCLAAAASLGRDGFGSGASRLVCGNMTEHTALEHKIAAFKKAEQCLLFNTGYMANIGIISSLFGREDAVFSDKLNHASIIDGIVLSRAGFYRYAHTDMESLESLLVRHGDVSGKRAIITDSVFSMDGDIAPLDKIVALAKKYNCYVMIDEAHAFGVMGEHGKGAAEHFGVEEQIDIQMGTLSKAAGSFGAYCCGRTELITFLMNKARSFIYTTGMPPSVAAASSAALDIIQNEPERRERLWDNAGYVRAGLKQMGFDTLNSQTPIIPVLIRDNQKTLLFSRRLLEKGLFISAIRPPTVPVNTARLRLTVTSAHQREDLELLLEQLAIIGKDLCLL